MPATVSPINPQTVGCNTQEIANQILFGSGYTHLKIPIDFTLANNAVLYTVPTLPGNVDALVLNRVYWEVTTSFAGGASSAIGVKSSNANYAANGDLIGGLTGDVAATLVSTGVKYKPGTAGPVMTATARVALVTGDTIIFQRITSTFTSGAGFLHVDAHWVG